MPGDERLIQIVDGALAEAARKAGDWLVCRPGCCACCLGPFSISALDGQRLRRGLEELEALEPLRASGIRLRAAESRDRLRRLLPGDTVGRALAEDVAEDEPCPVLDPATGTCELYAWRPLQCRTFGPPVACGDEAVGICELCFEGATEVEIAACTVILDTDELEAPLLASLGHEETIVAFALDGD